MRTNVLITFCLLLLMSAHALLSSAAERPASLQELMQLREYEDWSNLELATRHIKGQTSCHGAAPDCGQVKLLRAEALFGLRRPEDIAEADAIVNPIIQRQDASLSRLGAAFYDAADILYAKGLRQRPQAKLDESASILRATLARKLTKDNRLRALGELAYVARQQGKTSEAHGLYASLEQLSQELGSLEGLVSSKIGLALVKFDQEQYDESIYEFNEVLRRIIDQRGHTQFNRRAAFVYGNLGAVHKVIGNFEEALSLYRKARTYILRLDPEAFRTHYLIEMASGLRLTGKPAEAVRMLDDEYFPFAVGGFSYDYYALREKALALRDQGQLVGASQTMSAAIDLRLKIGGQRKIGEYYADLALIKLELGEVDAALKTLKEALALALRQNDLRSEWMLMFGLFEAHIKNKERDLAIYWGKQTVNRLQSIRKKLSLGNEAIQASYLRNIQHVYQRLATLLIEAGRIPEAEHVLAMLKERELGELVRAGTDATQTLADYVGPERRASEEWGQLASSGIQDALELAQLERRIDKREVLTVAEEARRQVLLNAVEDWNAEFERYTTRLRELFSPSAQAYVAKDTEVSSTRLQAKVALDSEGAVGLHYVVADERIAIIVATPHASFGRFSNISRDQLNRLINELRQAMVQRTDPRRPAQALWQVLIAPIQADIQAANAKTLVLSLTDTLRYLPFAALQDPNGRYLVEDLALTLWAQAADIHPTPSTQAWQVAGLGLTQARPGFSALPAVKGELQSIVRTDLSPSGVLPGRIEMDDQFGRTQLDLALRGQTNVLHIASHFDFKPGDESRSVLLLGRGESISLGKLAAMNFARVEQLTLSACDTATGGGVNENGKEVESLAATLLSKQAKAVLATLWKVADDSTAELMRRFYAQRAQATPPSRAQALRQAQLALLHGPKGAPKGDETERGAKRTDTPATEPNTAQPADPNRPYAHPYYWAPFVLSGSWL